MPRPRYWTINDLTQEEAEECNYCPDDDAMTFVGDHEEARHAIACPICGAYSESHIISIGCAHVAFFYHNNEYDYIDNTLKAKHPDIGVIANDNDWDYTGDDDDGDDIKFSGFEKILPDLIVVPRSLEGPHGMGSEYLAVGFSKMLGA
ncbi:MAG: hypothetical protein WCJ64_02200 [Rhodospirillaceae bacterium]